MLAELRNEFEIVDSNLQEILKIVPPDRIYWKPFSHATFLKVLSVGELIIHIAQIQEYLFNGLSANYWDHPHEWTTREALPDPQRISEYLNEVAQVRRRVFHYLTEQDLQKLVFLPDRTPHTIGSLLIRTLMHISHHRGQVYAYVHLFSDARLPAISQTGASYKKLV
ncbi:MAG: DinB family protein [Acidobacteriota bacterium]|nr:DinB family protein [Blastocatellia bacterium]MDW8411930.1 DinB family protein [Acidobacteriota bacterium]